ncbi:MAG TPA: isoleucine--tRNA ligase, partial [Gemmatimonadales bacterium]|nr:isoleucine--tRNA ligase [Gemmatimonadales bacterium]
MGRFPAWPATATALEDGILGTWQAERLFEQVQASRQGGAPFVFFEGPPTANGRPGIHHVFARTIKDLICRFQVAQGRQVTRKAGWDTHGLPVELEVEKKLGFTGKKDIEAYGVEKFNALCRESVFQYKGDWEKLSERIAFWLDYSDPYITYSNDYVESVWWILSELAKKDLLYRGHRVLPYCPRCGTALSSHELALGYEEITDKSIYVTFPLTDGSGRELVVWTTTPWTLPSNVAAAVDPELDYGVYEVGGRKLVLADARAGAIKVQGKAISESPRVGGVKGKELIGLRYTRPLDVVPDPESGKHSIVIGGKFVTAEDGSGIVHMAPAFGSDDHAAGKEHGLAMIRPVAMDGTFKGTTWPELEGKLVTADATNELIIRKLKELGRHLLTEQHVHSYPHCWRCSSKLIYFAKDSWFVRTSAVKDRMLEINQGVNWNPPEIGAGRFGAWLENNVDWALSRDRYWGTPLPAWVCTEDARHVTVIGSYAELAQAAGKPLPKDFDPHKPFIDAWQWKCRCGGTMQRTPEVIDTWFDSGSMPIAQWHYPFENKAKAEAHAVADYICEGVDQTRGWFYSLLAIATTVFDRPAYKNVIVNELVLDAEGQKMSKSKGNVVDPWKVIDQYGADTARLYLLASSQVWLPKRFDLKGIPESVGGFLNTLRNTYNFFEMYAGEWTPAAAAPQRPSARADRWILGRLDATVAAVTAAWAGYDVTAGTRAIFDFVVDDLSNWYVRTNRARFWAPDRPSGDPAALATLHECLVTVARLLAPAAPFHSDWLHRALTGDSVHLVDWPKDRGRMEPDLDQAMNAVRRLASCGRSFREMFRLKVRQPLGLATVSMPASARNDHFSALVPLLKSEINVKDLAYANASNPIVRFVARPKFKELGKVFGKETPKVAGVLKGLPEAELYRLDSEGTITVHVDGVPRKISKEYLDIGVEVADKAVAYDGPYALLIDTTLTPDLEAEGLARELVSRVQRMRKDAGFSVTDRIALAVRGAAPVVEAARNHGSFITAETLAR